MSWVLVLVWMNMENIFMRCCMWTVIECMCAYDYHRLQVCEYRYYYRGESVPVFIMVITVYTQIKHVFFYILYFVITLKLTSWNACVWYVYGVCVVWGMCGVCAYVCGVCGGYVCGVCVCVCVYVCGVYGEYVCGVCVSVCGVCVCGLCVWCVCGLCVWCVRCVCVWCVHVFYLPLPLYAAM